MKKLLALLLTFVGVLFAVPASAKNLKALEINAERLIIARGDVDEEMADKVVNALVTMEKVDAKKPIYMIINSYGGSIPDGARIVAALSATDVPVVCVVDEKAYSMAAVILQYCDERYVQKFADLLFHPASFRVGGQENQVESQVKHIKAYLDIFHKDVAQRLKLTEAAYKKQIANDWWLTSQQAVSAGAADGTVEALKYYYEAPKKNLWFFFRKAPSDSDVHPHAPSIDLIRRRSPEPELR